MDDLTPPAPPAERTGPLVGGLLAVYWSLLTGYAPSWGLRSAPGERLLLLSWSGLLALYLGTRRSDAPSLGWLALPLAAATGILLINPPFSGEVVLLALVAGGWGWLALHDRLPAAYRRVLQRPPFQLALAGLGLAAVGQLSVADVRDVLYVCGGGLTVVALAVGSQLRRPGLLLVAATLVASVWLSWNGFSRMEPQAGWLFNGGNRALAVWLVWVWAPILALSATYVWDAFRPVEPAPRWCWWRLGTILVLAGALRLTTLWTWASPGSDFYVICNRACALLASGSNPYQHVKYIDQMPPPGTFGYVPELQYTFVYPPGVPFLNMPGYWLGDIRYTYLAVDCAIVVMWLLLSGRPRGPDALAQMIVLLYLFNPTATYMLAQGWNDPLVLLWLSIAVCLRWRRRAGGLSAVLGLALATKHQALTMLLPSWRLFWSRPRLLGWTVLGALGPCVPFLLLDAPEFIRHMTVTLRVGPRTDALDLANYLQECHWPWVPGVTTAISIAIVLVLLLVPRRDTVSGWLLGVTTVAFTLYFLAKWAFVNYYWFVTGSLQLALLVITSAPALAASPLAPDSIRPGGEGQVQTDEKQTV